MSISTKFSDNADTADPGTTFWKLLVWKHVCLDWESQGKFFVKVSQILLRQQDFYSITQTYTVQMDTQQALK